MCIWCGSGGFRRKPMTWSLFFLLACPDEFKTPFWMCRLSKKYSSALVTSPESKLKSWLFLFLKQSIWNSEPLLFYALCLPHKDTSSPFSGARLNPLGTASSLRASAFEQKSCGPYVLTVPEGGAGPSWPGGHQQGVTGFSGSNHVGAALHPDL